MVDCEKTSVIVEGIEVICDEIWVLNEIVPDFADGFESSY
jgi:hypothetical protein